MEPGLISVPLQDIARGEVPNRAILPPPTEYSIFIREENRETVAAEICKVMDGLDLRWIWKQERGAGLAFANENVWSRAARRKKQQGRVNDLSNADSMEIDGREQEEDMEEEAEEAVSLGVKISVSSESVGIRWLRGLDYVLFESFCGMLKRHLAN
jgi:23S rRNA (adenine1618-N6)-methyltransferase